MKSSDEVKQAEFGANLFARLKKKSTRECYANAQISNESKELESKAPSARPQGLGLGAPTEISIRTPGQCVKVTDGTYTGLQGTVVRSKSNAGEGTVCIRLTPWLRSTWVKVLSSPGTVSTSASFIHVHANNLRRVAFGELRSMKAEIQKHCKWLTPGLIVRARGEKSDSVVENAKYMVLHLLDEGYALLEAVQKMNNPLEPSIVISRVECLDTVIGNSGSLVKIIQYYSMNNEDLQPNKQQLETTALGEVVQKNLITATAKIRIRRDARGDYPCRLSNMTTDGEIDMKFENICAFHQDHTVQM